MAATDRVLKLRVAGGEFTPSVVPGSRLLAVSPGVFGFDSFGLLVTSGIA
jgi:hypothetical protein